MWVARHPYAAGYRGGAALLLASLLLNISSRLFERPSLPAWRPITWEITSFCGSLAALWLVVWAVRRGTMVTRARVVALHLAAATAYSAIHCTVMWTLRRAVYTVAGAPYGWSVSFGQILYEYRKDVFAYATLGILYWAAVRAVAASAAPLNPALNPAPNPAPAAPIGPPGSGIPLFEIRDGAHLLRVPVPTILAAESSGNYVTIRLQDGREKLMRATLAQVESLLTSHGFLRVHRSWLVNPAHVREITPTGAGDYRVMLDSGLLVPLSRRYPEAARSLRAPGG